MGKVAIMTDSNSGITQQQGKELGIYVLPMPFIINGEQFLEGAGLTQEMFYEKQLGGADISTSQPSPASVTDMWDDILKEYDEIVHIPMSSGLSESCATAQMLAKEDAYAGKVFVADNKRISVTQRQSVLDAVELAKTGLNGAQVRDYTEKEGPNSNVYFMVDTLKYLKKGGRITPAAALMGTILNIKPVLLFNGDKLDRFGKARGSKQGRKIIIDAIKNDLQTRYADVAAPDKMWLQMIYAHNPETHAEFKKELETELPGYPIFDADVPLSIATHTGPGILSVACTKKLDYKK